MGKFSLAIAHAVREGDAAALDRCGAGLSLRLNRFRTVPTPVFRCLVGLLGDEFLRMPEGTSGFVHRLLFGWDRFPAAQRDELLPVLEAAFARLGEWLTRFVIAETIGDRFANQRGLDVLGRLVQEAEGESRAIALHGLEHLAAGATDEHVARFAFDQLVRLEDDPSEAVRDEADESLARLWGRFPTSERTRPGWRRGMRSRICRAPENHLRNHLGNSQPNRMTRKARVLLLAALLWAAPLAAQEPGARRRPDADAGPAAFLLAHRAELSLTTLQVAALQRLKERAAAQNQELHAAISAERNAVVDEERRSASAGARPAARPSAPPSARRAASREAETRHRANIAREANEARAVLTEEQWKRLHAGLAARP